MGKGDIQPWNNPPERGQDLRSAEEADPLKKEKEEVIKA